MKKGHYFQMKGAIFLSKLRMQKIIACFHFWLTSWRSLIVVPCHHKEKVSERSEPHNKFGIQWLRGYKFGEFCCLCYWAFSFLYGPLYTIVRPVNKCIVHRVWMLEIITINVIKFLLSIHTIKQLIIQVTTRKVTTQSCAHCRRLFDTSVLPSQCPDSLYYLAK